MRRILLKSGTTRAALGNWPFILVLVTNLLHGSDTERRLEAAIQREIVAGDLPGALEEYRKILAIPGLPRAAAARAWFQTGQCLEKAGRRPEAKAAYQRVMKEYASEAESAAKARDRLADFENSIPGPLNLKFDQGEIGRLPEGWFVPALPKDADLWAQLRNRGCMLRPSCAVVLAPETAPAHVGNLMQSFSAAAYRGKTVVLKAWLRLDAEEREDRAQMWLAVDRPNNRRGFFDDMKDRPVRGPDWTHCEIRTEVDADAAYIKFGVMSFGRGKVWVDGVSFETARP